MRERNRNHQPETPDRNQGIRQYEGQGERPDVNSEQVRNRREKEVQRQYEQKQAEVRRRQQELEYEQQQRAIEEERRKQNPEKEYQQNRSERIQKTEQQKKAMQKERERNTRSVDTSGTKRNERVQTRSVRQNRR